jgi:hypothetical protein
MPVLYMATARAYPRLSVKFVVWRSGASGSRSYNVCGERQFAATNASRQPCQVRPGLLRPEGRVPSMWHK